MPAVNGTSATNGEGVLLSITPLLKQLDVIVRQNMTSKHPVPITSSMADEIAFAISSVFSNALSPEQTALLLRDMSLTGYEQQPEVLAKCAAVMREAAEPVDIDQLREHIIARQAAVNGYHGGLCDIVGTGGDNHKTFNVSTASSIICSALLTIAKHGNRASTSRSGSSDVLGCLQLQRPAKLDVVGPEALQSVYAAGNYGFLFAPNFHKALRHVASIRKQLAHPSLFNLLGPLTNPAGPAIEARVVGVKRKDLVPVFAEALRLSGAKKSLVVCGDEDLDEISPAGISHCAILVDSSSAPLQTSIEYFTVSPEDFDLPRHSLQDVQPGKSAEENAELLLKILKNQVSFDAPVLHFVLMNAAALFVISGVCEGPKSAFGDDSPVDATVGPGGCRWREGVRLARAALENGRSLDMVERFAAVTHQQG